MVVWVCLVTMLVGVVVGKLWVGSLIKKTMPKKTIVKISYSSFDQPNLQSLNDYIFVIFILRLQF